MWRFLSSEAALHTADPYRTLSGSVTTTLSRTEQAVSMLGSLLTEPLLRPLSDVQHCDRKSTSRAWLSKVSSTLRGPSSADRWHRAGRRYLQARRGQEVMSEGHRLRPFMTDGVYLRASFRVHAPLSPETDTVDIRSQVSCSEASPRMWLREYPIKNGSSLVTSSFRQEVSSASQEHRQRKVAKIKGSV